MKYANKVFHLWDLVKAVPDPRSRRTYPAERLWLAAIGLFLLQYPSLNSVFNGHGCMDRKLQHLLGWKQKIPSRYAVEDLMAATDPQELKRILVLMGRIMKKNKVWRRNAMDGRVVVAMDGVELITSSKKDLSGALHRTHGNGTEDAYCRSVVAMTVGGAQKVVLGQVMLQAGDGDSKAEGELTGAHRLLDELYASYGRFCDVLVMDALYLNAPLLKHVDSLDMKAVVRLKGQQRLLYKDYKPLFDRDVYRSDSFETDQFTVSVWDCRDAEMTDYEGEIRLLRFCEQPRKATKDVPSSRDMWVVTTEMDASARQIWQIMHQRWDIELNGFHQLKTYYHVDHCFCKRAVEQFFLTALIAFNLREAYLFGLRARDVSRLGVTRRDLTEFLRNDLEVHPLGLFPHDRSGHRKRRKQ